MPGDKSLSHRAVLFAAMADGTSHLSGVLDSADVRSTIAAVQALGARVLRPSPGDREARELHLVVDGWGASGPREPSAPLDCGNSGTTARLLLGVLAGWPLTVVLEGDASLSRRPMGRVTAPLEKMGARFESTGGMLPVTVHGSALGGIDYVSPIASAQVKSAVLLAGLAAPGRTSVREPAPSRDHTERLLPAFGVSVGRDADVCTAWVEGPAGLTACDVAVPGDPSSAAFLVVAAILLPESAVTIIDVGLNPTRTGFIEVLSRMGAEVAASVTAAVGEDADTRGDIRGEPVGTVSARYSAGLRATVVTAAEVPSLIDEIPVLALAASRATGRTLFEGVGELRVKESDRLSAIEGGLSALGVEVESGPDWLAVTGPSKLGTARLSSRGDHRLAMTWAVAGLAAEGPVEIEGFEAVDVSYPTFAEDIATLLG